jgi:protein-tyrosine phosphatase
VNRPQPPTPAAGARLPLEGAFNFRDLGGYPTDDGQRTRTGRLFRSDGLQALSDADVRALRQLGLRTVIDLRTAEEVERLGRGPLASEPVHYEHLTVLPTQEEAGESHAAPETDDLADRYLWYLDVGRAAIARALELAGDPDRQPLVFHCAAGKDRTGVVAAMILDCAGVAGADIVADYTRTNESLPAILERLGATPERLEAEGVPRSRLNAHADTMERFLAGLHDRHGGAASWAIDAGADPRRIAGLRATLVGADPSISCPSVQEQGRN